MHGFQIVDTSRVCRKVCGENQTRAFASLTRFNSNYEVLKIRPL
jgi:hypothetical protein